MLRKEAKIIRYAFEWQDVRNATCRFCSVVLVYRSDRARPQTNVNLPKVMFSYDLCVTYVSLPENREIASCAMPHASHALS
jgi:hypothetical protein